MVFPKAVFSFGCEKLVIWFSRKLKVVQKDAKQPKIYAMF